jgi:hypothetical protein
MISVIVPPGTFAVTAHGIFQSNSGLASALCRLLSPTGGVVHQVYADGDFATVSDTPVSVDGIVSTTTGGAITVACGLGTGSAYAGDFNIVAVQLSGGAVMRAGVATSSATVTRGPLPIK